MRWANFADTFWYLDAMAAKAANGYSVFCRQDFVGIDYGMVDCATYDPLPDYYGGILWSKLMGTSVIATKSSDANTVRAYAHCSAKSDDNLTLLLLNLASTQVNVTLGGAKVATAARTEYFLTGPNGTDGQIVALNDKQLLLSDTGKLPSLTGRVGKPGSLLVMPPASIAFVEFNGVGCGSADADVVVV